MATTDHDDEIITGSGVGGASLARRLAPSHKRILLLERGGHLPPERDKVLDVDGKTHEPDNLDVADCTFFASIGRREPEVTIIANALRMGDHLLERLGRGTARSPR